MAEYASLNTTEILKAVASVIPSPAALHEPQIKGRELDCVRECLESGWVSYAGTFVERFESMLCDITGASFAIAMVSGTAALHIAQIVSGVSSGDEVLVPALTFVATANAVTYLGAVPHFVDSHPTSLGVDVDALAVYLARISEMQDGYTINRSSGRRIAAIIPMHVFGHPVDMDALNALCASYNISVVEDAAEALGSVYRGRSAGTLGKVAALSFNGNKIVTTGGGGALLTNDEELARQARHLSTTSKVPHRWEFFHDQVGYNYRMPSLNAALGCAQLEQLNSFVEAKRTLASKYISALSSNSDVAVLREETYNTSNYWLNAVLLHPKFSADKTNRDLLLCALNDAGYMARPVWNPMHNLPMYSGCPRMQLPVTESLHNRIINLPSSVGLARL